MLCINTAGYAAFKYNGDLMIDNASVNPYYYNSSIYYYVTPVTTGRVYSSGNYVFNNTTANTGAGSRYNTVPAAEYQQTYADKVNDPRNYYMYDEAKEQAGLYNH